MEKKIFDDYGIEIFENLGKYIIRVDSGELASRHVEAEISAEDAIIAQQSPQASYEILMKYKNKGLFRYI